MERLPALGLLRCAHYVAVDVSTADTATAQQMLNVLLDRGAAAHAHVDQHL